MTAHQSYQGIDILVKEQKSGDEGRTEGASSFQMEGPGEKENCCTLRIAKGGIGDVMHRTSRTSSQSRTGNQRKKVPRQGALERITCIGNSSGCGTPKAKRVGSRRVSRRLRGRNKAEVVLNGAGSCQSLKET